MLQEVVNIDNDIQQNGMFQEQLSLWPFLNYVERTIAHEGTDMLLPKLAEAHIRSSIAANGDLQQDNVAAFAPVFEMIYHLAKGVPTDKKVKWALGYPIPDRVFFGTEDFYELVRTDFDRVTTEQGHRVFNIEFLNKQIFLLLLERFYDMPPLGTKRRYVKRESTFSKYYELLIDFTFVDVQTTADLPILDLSSIKEKENIEYSDIEPILDLFDLSKFTFSGFSILTFVDCHQEYVTESLQDLINNLNIFKGQDGLVKINEILTNIAFFEGIKTSFYPILKLNDAPILSPDLAKDSLLLADDFFYQHYINQGELYQYLEKPHILSYGVEDGLETASTNLIKSLVKTGVSSYVCFPLVHNDTFVGIFEVYSKTGVQLTRNMLIQIQTFYPLLAQLANEIVSGFRNELNNIILHRYTALQPAVEWKFNQVAAQYLGEVLYNYQQPELEKIAFKEVYPFYAAVDVKDSSYLRNKSYREDIQVRMNYIRNLMEEAQRTTQLEEEEGFVKRFDEVYEWSTGNNLDHYLLDILAFFQEDVPQFLDRMEGKYPEAHTFLRNCRKNLQYSYKEFNSSNESFEQSLKKLNQLIVKNMQEFNAEIQQIFPSYFETFRTDGVEYDLYVGQSISPVTPFDLRILKQIRVLQIINIAKIGAMTHALRSKLPIPLETTQLIFIHPNPIDISFREDERRFDVEGSYNIRYQIIKKRIDKAHLKNSTERLVQPGTIAIVYSRNQVARELRTCLQEVIKLNYIEPEYEELELENLQGVSDLKAIRVRIKLNETNTINP